MQYLFVSVVYYHKQHLIKVSRLAIASKSGLLLSAPDITQSLANLHLLSSMYIEYEVLRCLENQHDRAPKTEASHFLARMYRLSSQDLTCIAVNSLHERSRRWPASANVRAQL